MNAIVAPAMLAQPYMQNAFASAAVAALLAGFVGYFVVLRAATFAAHAYAQFGFAGAAGAVLIGADPLWGLVSFALVGAAFNGVIGERERTSDVSTALLMAATLGLGALFLVLNNSFATAAFSLLFGNIVGVSREQVRTVAVLGLLCAIVLAVMYRPLLFASVNVEAALARGVPIRFVGAAFSMLLAVAAAITVPTVGTLLIFSLLVGPAAAAVRLTHDPIRGIALAMTIALLTSWAGIATAYATGWPVGFFVTVFIAIVYVAARVRSSTHSKLHGGSP